jgi:hypothetical protein
MIDRVIRPFAELPVKLPVRLEQVPCDQRQLTDPAGQRVFADAVLDAEGALLELVAHRAVRFFGGIERNSAGLLGKRQISVTREIGVDHAPQHDQTIMKRLRALPNRRRELWEMAERIFDHLEAELPGWGEWPQDMGEAIFVGVCLGAIVAQEADRLVWALDPEELSDMEATCRTEGISTEEYILRLIVQRKESKEND